MTQPEQGSGGGVTRVAAAAARSLFVSLIPDLVQQSHEYIVDTDVIDAEILELFADKMRATADALTVACARHDVQVVRDKGHSLEGMGGTLGFPEISVVGRELSQAARSGDWSRCAAFAERLSRWVGTLSPAGERPHD